MTDNDLDDHEQDDSWILRRRGLLKGAGGLAALGAVGASAESAFEPAGDTVLGIGGGSMADAAEQYRVKYYAPTWSEFQNDFSPGVRGRVIEIIDDGNTHDGEVYFDNGTSFRQPPVKTPEISTEDADITNLTATAGWSIYLEGPYAAERVDFVTDEILTPDSMVCSWLGGHTTPTIFRDQTADNVYRTTPKGTIEQEGSTTVGATSGAGPAFVCPTIRKQWLVIQGASDPRTAYVYGSSADWDDTANALGTQASVNAPRRFDAEVLHDPNDTGDAQEQVIWAEYGSGQTTWNVYKAKGDGTITSVLSSSSIDHFHNLEHDPHNRGTLYVTSGDGTDARYWWKSTDYGNTWTQISDIGDNHATDDPRKWKTVRVSFDDSYLYWGTDGNVNEGGFNAPRFYRAPRNDLANPEELLNYADTPWGNDYSDPKLAVYGICRLENPEGFLIGHVINDNSVSGGKAPVFFWDSRAEKMRRVYEVQTTGSGTLRGVYAMSKYPDNSTGRVYVALNDYDTVRSGSRDWTTFAAHGLSVPKLME